MTSTTFLEGSIKQHNKKELHLFIYLLKAYSPVNRTASPQGFLLVHILAHNSHMYCSKNDASKGVAGNE